MSTPLVWVCRPSAGRFLFVLGARVITPLLGFPPQPLLVGVPGRPQSSETARVGRAHLDTRNHHCAKYSSVGGGEKSEYCM